MEAPFALATPAALEAVEQQVVLGALTGSKTLKELDVVVVSDKRHTFNLKPIGFTSAR